ncbi:hypothetical protein IWZ00DRAFT_164078 [Phyllosticta capitalensis]|uniref:Uncharacterized protein n=1 Tax=Phyllosticta capitalensis TaxID=121624 RepID=A0ABR1YZI9_9PEZI
MWWERVFKLIKFDPGHPVKVHCDNQQTGMGPFSLSQLRHMIRMVIDRADHLLYSRLLFCGGDEGGEIRKEIQKVPWPALRDDLMEARPGYCFLDNKASGHPELHVGNRQELLLKRVSTLGDGRQLPIVADDFDQARASVERYLQDVFDFLDLLYVAIHMTGGQPPRASELLTLKYGNTCTESRNVFIEDGGVMLMLKYCKTFHKTGSHL